MWLNPEKRNLVVLGLEEWCFMGSLGGYYCLLMIGVVVILLLHGLHRQSPQRRNPSPTTTVSPYKAILGFPPCSNLFERENVREKRGARF